MRWRHQGSRVFDAAQADPRLRAGLIGWWVWDGAGTTLRDRSGYGNHGMSPASAYMTHTLGRNGARHAIENTYPGQASTNFVTLTSSIPAATVRTLAAWVCLRGSTAGCVFGNADSYGYMGLFYGADRFYITAPAASDYWDIDRSTFTGQWRHVCMATDGINVEVFFDGVTIGSKTLPGFARVQIIGSGQDYNFPFPGIVDDARVYSRTLSSAEIALLASPSFRPVLPARRYAIPVPPQSVSITGSGGMVMGGAATTTRGVRVSPTSGMQIGGAATITRGVSVTPAGGMAIGGTAPITRGVAHVPSGGMQTGGTGLPHVGVTRIGTGGLVMGGAAGLLRGVVAVTTGGLHLAGAALLRRGVTVIGAGGLVVSGAATTWGLRVTPTSRTLTARAGSRVTTLAAVSRTHTARATSRTWSAR